MFYFLDAYSLKLFKNSSRQMYKKYACLKTLEFC